MIRSFTRTCCAVGIAALTLTGFSAPVAATVLRFDDLAERQFVPDNYGDRVISATTDGFNYGTDFGFTPNVIVEFDPDGNFQQYNAWTGYAGLDRALGHDLFGVPGEIRLLPDPGFNVVLHSFDIGVWQRDFSNSRIRVFSLANDTTPLFDTGLTTLELRPNGAVNPDNYAYTFAPGLVSSAGLRIVINDLGNLAIDNLSFSQTAVPLPAALPLFACALGGLAVARRRRA